MNCLFQIRNSQQYQLSAMIFLKAAIWLLIGLQYVVLVLGFGTTLSKACDSTNIFQAPIFSHKGLYNKSLRLCRQYGVCTGTQLHYFIVVQKQTEAMSMNGWVCVPVKLHGHWNLNFIKCSFVTKYYSFDFSNYLKL